MMKLFASPREAGGGGPGEAWWRGNCRGLGGSRSHFTFLAIYPSIDDPRAGRPRVVPLPTSFARREAKGPPSPLRNIA